MSVVQTHPERLTEEQLLAMPHIGKAEMIDGRIIVAPAGSEHGGISALLLMALLNHVRAHHLGMVFDSSTGFWMRNGDLLSPDVAFVAGARLKGMKRLPRRFFQGSPNLAAEILSPNDKAAEMDRKRQSYFETDTKLLWIIDPEQQVARIHLPGMGERVVTMGDHLDGEDVVPGFKLALAELLALPDFD